MKILAIETSCDETGLALIEAQGKRQGTRDKEQEIKVLVNLVQSQIEKHAPYGGVVPNIAKREHKRVLPILWKELKNEVLRPPRQARGRQAQDGNQVDIDLIAVTQGPGLSPCLWQGIEFAKKISEELGVKLYGINHLKGHFYVVFPEEDIEYPVVSLIVSGGHTELVYSKKLGDFKILGRTRDDAAGEAFDKVARMLGLGFPGGPEISRVAEKGNEKRFVLPRPMIDSKDLDFSFAGLKTAVMNLTRGVTPNTQLLELNDQNVADVAASFQRSAVDVLVEKTIRATRQYPAKTVILGGGVAANTLLREELKEAVKKRLPGTKLVLPDRKLTTDNALMIALASWYERKNLVLEKDLAAMPNLKITDK